MSGRPDDRIDEHLLDESAEELYENAPVAYFSSLLDGRLVKVNETLLVWTRFTREELLGGKRFHDLLAPGARIYYETHYAPLLQMQGQVREIAVELVRADGTRLPVLMNSVVVRDEDGAPRLVRTTAFNASERRRYERELLAARAAAESRARAAHALAHVVEGVLVVGDDGRVQLLNEAAEKILGASAVSVVGRRAVDVLEGWEAVAARTSTGRGGEVPAAEVVPLARGGREQWLSVAAVAAGDAVVYTLRDVTAERDLDQLRSDLIAIVSHELRTPLAGVYGAAQTLLERFEALDAGTRRQFLGVIVDQSERLAKILDQILLTSRLDSGNVDTHVAPFELGAAVETVLQALDSTGRRRVVVSLPPSLHVEADLDRLRQVLANLVDNALKYSSGSVRVSAERREWAVRVTVADDGPGIPPPDRERVFEKFFRVDPSQQTGGGGTGLGLYIARELVQRMGGRIGYLPRDRGTTFFVDVPCAS